MLNGQKETSSCSGCLVGFDDESLGFEREKLFGSEGIGQKCSLDHEEMHSAPKRAQIVT